MISICSGQTQVAALPRPTAWGLSPTQLHDHYWAARGVQVVRQGEGCALESDAEQYLLTGPRTLVMFRLNGLVDLLSWVRPKVLFVRVVSTRDRSYRELAITDDAGRFVSFHREYGQLSASMARVALTRDRELAEFWNNAPDTREAWRSLRSRTRRSRREAVTLRAKAYDRAADADVAQFIRDLVEYWSTPGAVLGNVQRIGNNVWAHRDYKPDRSVVFVGPVWIGNGRRLEPNQTVLGPAILWDDPDSRPVAQSRRIEEIEPLTNSESAAAFRPTWSGADRIAKRTFDIVFATVALLLTLPLYPLVMLAIWLEDGRPFFFAHRRETINGREFPCLKFRSMRKDAEKIKAELVKENKADGPQFFVEEDPRLTRVGQIIRKLNIDELPQFLNVLVGHMSVVGPRPSPRQENQFCPAWREARLSLRPGVTGLWQVMRTRRAGFDFQEWIKYDIQYVQTVSAKLDLWIILKTVLICLRGGR